MKKIFVGKDEGVAEVVERIIGAEEEEVALVVPKNAEIGSSVANFHLIRREAQAAQKKAVIESVDESVLAFAKESGLESLHSFFDGEKKSSSLSDIVPVSKEPREESEEEVAAVVRSRKRRKPKEASREPAEPEEKAEAVPHEEQEGRAAEEIENTREAGGSKEFREEEPARRMKWKLVVLIAGAALLAGLAFWITTAFFSRATVTIDFIKTPWTYNHALVADTKVSKVNPDGNVLPAELFTSQKNLTKLFPASASKNVSQKARGTVTIYNAYSSSPQSLVATTRFVTPDGKIFRLTDAVIVPGAKITDGKIISASIDAGVTADQAGPDYNVGPLAHLTIPGFKGSPKYDGFYGEFKAAAQGGFIGQKAVPTASDIQKAKDSMTSILKTTLETSFLAGYPPGFKILDGSSNLNVTKLTVNENTNADGNFSVFGEATISAIGFRESDMKSLLTALASKDHPGSVLATSTQDYTGVRADFKNGSVAFTIAAQATLKPNFSAGDFKTKITGKSVNEVKSLISRLPGLSGARVSVWPIWLGSIPSDSRKVLVNVN